MFIWVHTTYTYLWLCSQYINTKTRHTLYTLLKHTRVFWNERGAEPCGARVNSCTNGRATPRDGPSRGPAWPGPRAQKLVRNQMLPECCPTQLGPWSLRMEAGTPGGGGGGGLPCAAWRRGRKGYIELGLELGLGLGLGVELG